MSIKTLSVILLGSFFYYLPVFINPNLLLDRGNDLEEVFWPVFYFIRDNFLRTGTIPLWNNLFLSGTPLLPDPQFSLFYPPNLLFIILPTDPAFIIYFFMHTFFAGVGAFLLAKYGLNFKHPVSIFASLLYIFTPKAVGFLEAGHYGLFATLTWVPLLILAVLKLVRDPKISWTILLSVTLSGLFYTHTIIFLIGIASSILLYLILLILERKIFTKQSLVFILLSFVLTLGLISASLLPQLEWMPNTTRFLLLQDRDTYPKWASKGEFLEISTVPWLLGVNKLQKIDSEKWIPLGSVMLILATIGFLALNRRLKIIITLSFAVILLIILNNASPVYSFLLSQDWFVLMRISTRLWIVVTAIIIFLASYGLDRLMVSKNKKIVYLIALAALAESLSLGYIRLQTPILKSNNFVPNEVYEFLSKDPDHSRVYCTTRCIPQKQAAIHHLELVDGYNTLQQKNFYQQAWQLTGGYWNYYTLSIPPIGLYTFEKLQPDPIALGHYNAKYIISPYLLVNSKLQLVNQFDTFLIYQNLSFLPRAYYLDQNLKYVSGAQIAYYSSNYIKIDTTSHLGDNLVLSEVYSPGWVAYENGNKKIEIKERPDRLRSVGLHPSTNFIEFRYLPQSFIISRVIFSITVLGFIIFLIRWFFQNSQTK